MNTQLTTTDDVRRRLREITTPARYWERPPDAPYVSARSIAADCRIHWTTLFRFMRGKGTYSKTIDLLIWWIDRYDKEQADNRENARSSHGAAG